tara:strand:- start:4643 stop:4888 length:246 start_codon:yes stop_codon:yes gene_type:complete
MNIYRFTIIGKCPGDDADDIYKVKLKTHLFIECESINAFIANNKEKKIYQEKFTAEIKKQFPYCKVKIKGYHSGIKVISLL